MKFLNLYNILLESRKDNYIAQLKDQNLAQSIFQLDNPKKQKMIIKWIKNGNIQYPKDIQIIDKVYEIINRKQLDFNNFNSPQEVIQKYSQLDQKINYNPDNEPCFTNKVQLDNGVVIYDVQDSKQGQLAVRKAVDYNFGKDAKPWCLITPPMQKALEYWQKYSAIPKRICFKNGKLLAFCANNKIKIKWWNRNDIPFDSLKFITHFTNDDPNAQKEIQQLHYNELKAVYETDPNQLKQIYQKYKYNNKIKMNLAANKYCPTDLLEQLSNDKNEEVRFYVDINPNAPKNIRTKDQKNKALKTYNDILNMFGVNPTDSQ